MKSMSELQHRRMGRWLPRIREMTNAGIVCNPSIEDTPV